jgi:ABC-2 type transport system ATP-binding protein
MRMELIAALLHSPDVLLLDEPTIGLDVVSQRRVQDFLKFYQSEKKITVVLTSHYMKDVEALCKRAIIINEGEIKHDGPLAQIVDRFSHHKIIEVQFADSIDASGLEEFGRVVEFEPPRAKLEVARAEVASILTALLSRFDIRDVGVQERPLEEVIAEVFTASSQPKADNSEIVLETRK